MEVQRDWKYIHQLEAKNEDLKHINEQLLAACEGLIEAAGPFMAEQLATLPECMALNCAVQIAREAIALAKGGA